MARGLQTLQVISMLCVAAAVIAGYLAAAGRLAMPSHIQWGFLIAIFTAFAHCMTLFYLIGSSSNVREAIKPYGWTDYMPEMSGFHRILSPWLTFAIMGGIMAVVTGGGAHTRVWPSWVHQMTALLTLGVNVIAAWKGIQVIEANVRLQGRLDASIRAAEEAAGEGS
jgi:hypothetical protein